MDISSKITTLLTAISQLSPPDQRIPTTNSTATSTTPNILHLLTHPSSTAAKTIFLTLHFLFPHDLLPALDLLDRRLVTCLVYTPETDTIDEARGTAREVYYIQSASAVTDHHSHQHPYAHNTSTSTSTSTTASTAQGAFRYRNPKPTQTFYTVHLDSWNCSCAAFAFSSLSLLSLQDTEPQEASDRPAGLREGMGTAADDDGDNGEFRFGGTLTREGTGVPVCKHILAACLGRVMPGWVLKGEDGGDGAGKAEEEEWRRRHVGREEMTGWGGGWGDC